MTFEHLTSRMSLDASDYVGAADDAASASEDITGSTDDMSQSLWDVEPAGIAAGGALAGLATAGQGVLDSTRETREGLDRTAETMGITSDAARDLATDMSDATFPIEDVEGTMDELVSMGIDTEEQMEQVAMSMDLVADATGNTASEVTESVGPALRAMGEDVEDVDEHMDTFTHIAQNTTMELDEFSRMATKLGPELQDMEMGVDDTAAVMSALEERGMDSRTAMREFRQATNDADGDQEELMESLGLTSEELEEQHDALEDAEGMTKDHAEAANDNVSTMDELRASFEDAKLQASAYLGPLSSLMPAAQAAGVAMIGLSTVNMTAVVPSFAAVSAAALPVTAAVLGIGAAIAAAYAIWERDLGGIQDKTETATAAIMDGLEWLVDGIEWAIDTADYVLTEWSPGETLSSAKDAMLSPIEDVREMIPGSIDEATDAATSIFREWHPAGIMLEHKEEILDALPGPEDAREAATGFIDGFTEALEDGRDRISGAMDTATGGASDYWPASDADKGAFSQLTDAGAAVPETIAGAAEGNAGALESGMAETVEQGAEGSSDAAATPAGAPTPTSAGAVVDRLEEILAALQQLGGPMRLESGRLEIDEAGLVEIVDGRIERADKSQLRNFQA